ncbi:MAG: OmpA family protein [Bacteroidetes bacterium]|nr:OmpA family protein [Bacteroidota bacterium]
MKGSFIQFLVFSLFTLLSQGLLAQSYDTKSLTIYFNSDEAELTSISKGSIRSFILELGSDQIREIYITGHTDSDASDEYNQKLSEKRAENARDFLKTQGVKDRMIKLEYFGEAQPLSSVKAQNRRVEMTFVVESVDSDTDISSNVQAVYVTTVDASNQDKLITHYSVEIKGKNRYGNSNKAGMSEFTGTQLSSQVVFSRDGYLNSIIDLSRELHGIHKDTIHLTVQMRKVKVLQKLRFEQIYFYTDSDVLKPESKPELDKLLTMLSKFPTMYVEIQGHMNYAANRRATSFQKMYNLDLSYRRAKAVHNFLVENGISPNRLTYKGMSNYNMVYPYPQSRAQEDMNKRVEVWTLEVEGNP